MSDLETDAAPRRRGRPKGTGIDDKALLRQITGLMASDRSLKPTTAIKRCGIENPSIVRRLREKLKLEPLEIKPAKIGRKPKSKLVAASSASRVPATRTATKAPPLQTEPKTLPSAPPAAVTPHGSPASDSRAKEAQKASEAALLAAYLKALQATAVPAFDDERTSNRTPHQQPIPEPQPQRTEPRETAAEPPRQTPQHPGAPTAPPFPFGQPPAGMMFPFFPPFMQPFAPKPPPPNPMLQGQMEALKLSVEVMTAVTKLQMFAYQSTLGATPFGNMLQAQTMMGQMLLASFAGFTGLGKKPDGK